MAKQRLVVFASRAIAVAGAAVLLLSARPGSGTARAPTSMEAAIARASALGLTIVPTNTNGQIYSSVVIAAVPTTPTDATRLTVGNFRSPQWIGRILIVPPTGLYTDGYPAENCQRWGDCVAFGDPELLQQMASDPPAP